MTGQLLRKIKGQSLPKSIKDGKMWRAVIAEGAQHIKETDDYIYEK